MIQDWLGHSEFSITANTYAHLETDSKLQSAQAMTWIDKTAFVQGGAVEPESKPQQEIALDAPVDAIREWLERSDFADAADAKEQLRTLLSSLSDDPLGNAKCQPV